MGNTQPPDRDDFDLSALRDLHLQEQQGPVRHVVGSMVGNYYLVLKQKGLPDDVIFLLTGQYNERLVEAVCSDWEAEQEFSRESRNS